MSSTKLSLSKGFSLIEVAISVLILGLVLSGVVSVYKASLDVSNLKIQRQQVTVIHESINTFLKANRYLPCPDTDGDGKEDRDDSTGVAVCDSREGSLPYADLGVQSLDAWGNPYYYRVNQRSESDSYVNDICEPASVLGRRGAYDIGDLHLCSSSNIYYCDDKCNDTGVCSGSCSQIDPRVNVLDTNGDGSFDSPGPPYFHLATPPYGTLTGSGNLNIEDEDGNSLGSGIVAVVISWGADGDLVNNNSCASGSKNEENCNGNTDFIDTRTDEERDFLTWVTVHQAKAAIISQRRLR